MVKKEEGKKEEGKKEKKMEKKMEDGSEEEEELFVWKCEQTATDGGRCFCLNTSETNICTACEKKTKKTTPYTSQNGKKTFSSVEEINGKTKNTCHECNISYTRGGRQRCAKCNNFLGKRQREEEEDEEEKRQKTMTDLDALEKRILNLKAILTSLTSTYAEQFEEDVGKEGFKKANDILKDITDFDWSYLKDLSSHSSPSKTAALLSLHERYKKEFEEKERTTSNAKVALGL